MNSLSSLLSYGFLAPPALFIVFCLAGALIALVWRRFGVAVVLLASLSLFAAATPALSSYLLRQAEAGILANADFHAAQAIVVLGGDQRIGNGADIPDTLGPLSLERVVFGAEAYRRLAVPLAVSGGLVPGAHAASAELMKSVLEQDLGVPVSWSEARSRTTYENAVFTAALLRPQNIGTVVLVTQAWHLPRAIWSFERSGLHVLPWPAPRATVQLDQIADFLPNIAALHDSFHALHELIGGIYYRLRY
jgi:uncharacterized SAM-binding protein YcdF (DUF218 family)